MNPIITYIEERIKFLDKEIDCRFWQDCRVISSWIYELQAVLSKIEELKDQTYQDEIAIPVYHHYRRKDGTVWHWTSENREELGEIPKDAVEITRQNLPPFKIEEIWK